MRTLINCFFILFIGFSITLNGQNVTPEVDGDIYSLKFNGLDFKVDASAGAKVPSFKINSNELLVTSDVSPGFLWGAVLWPAPQSEFGWPPPMGLDDGQYTASLEGNVMRFVSPIDKDGNDDEMQFVKDFWADDSEGAVSMKYSLINTGTNTITKALWELTRVPVNGLTFWPTGPEGTWGELASSTVEQDGHTWIDISAETRSGLKFFADGSDGWMAHVDEDRRIYIKSFDDVDHADFADGEAEIELWISDVYIELENLSAAEEILPDDSIHYTMKWHLHQLPDNISVEIGSAQLINYVNGVLDGTITDIESAPMTNLHRVFPNPANNYLTIALSSSHYGTVNLKVVDVMGKELINTAISSGQRLDIQDLPGGIYYYTIESDDNTEFGKFIKQ